MLLEVRALAWLMRLRWEVLSGLHLRNLDLRIRCACKMEALVINPAEPGLSKGPRAQDTLQQIEYQTQQLSAPHNHMSGHLAAMHAYREVHSPEHSRQKVLPSARVTMPVMTACTHRG